MGLARPQVVNKILLTYLLTFLIMEIKLRKEAARTSLFKMFMQLLVTNVEGLKLNKTNQASVTSQWLETTKTHISHLCTPLVIRGDRFLVAYSFVGLSVSIPLTVRYILSQVS